MVSRLDRQDNDLDHDAMEAASKGEQWAFEHIVSKYQGSLINYFLRFTQNLDTAKELSQEVFLRLYQARDRYRPETKFSTYLFTIAHNLAINEIFVKKRPETSADDNVPVESTPSNHRGPEQSLIDSEQTRQINEALARLSFRERSAVIMKYTEGLSYIEIAEITGSSIPAVESLLSRAKEKMRKHLTRTLQNR
jgi:RNA polymerase sigma-70 factor, ECF subfamily